MRTSDAAVHHSTGTPVGRWAVVALVLVMMGCGPSGPQEQRIDGRDGRCVSGTERQHVSFQGLAWDDPECSLWVANWELAVEEFGRPAGPWAVRWRDYAWQWIRGGDWYAGETFPHGVIHIARDPRRRVDAEEHGPLTDEVRVCYSALVHEEVHAYQMGRPEGAGGAVHGGWGDKNDGPEVDSIFGRIKRLAVRCLTMTHG